MWHRNSQKRLQVEDGIFALEANTKDRHPFFAEPIFCEVFIEQLGLCKQLRNFRLYAFALMPDHFHMLVQPGKGETISKVMHFLKRHISREINIHMGFFRNPHGENIDSRLLLPESEDRHPRLSNDDPRFPPFAWQSSFHDHLIRNERDFQNQYWYILRNPEKHGYTTDYTKYPYSSCSFHQDLIDSLVGA